jgi:hypothetical protein
MMAFMSLTGWAAQDISECEVQLKGMGLYTFNGLAQKIELNVYIAGAEKPLEATAYDVVCYEEDSTTPVTSGVINAGKYFAAAKGKGEFTGETKKIAFTVNQLSIAAGTVATTPTVADAGFTYNGKAKEFTTVTVKVGTTTLEEDKDYTISYENNINAGKADAENGPKLVVTGKGNYQGTAKVGFDIAAINLPEYSATAYSFTAVTANPTYTGAEATTLPKFVVKDGTATLEEGTDYEIAWYAAGSTTPLTKTVGTGTAAKVVYANPTNAGTYTAKIFGKGNYKPGTDGITQSTWTLTIDKAPLQIYVNSVSKVYDGTTDIYGGTVDNKVSPMISYSGLVGEDAGKAEPFGKFDVVYKTVAATNANVGSWTIIATPTTGATVSSNYDPKYLENGKLTVTAKAITIAPNDAEKELETDDDPAYKGIDVSKALTDDQDNIKKAYKVIRTNDAETVGKFEDVLALQELTDAEILAAAKVPATATDAAKKAVLDPIKTTKKNYAITTGTADFTISAGKLYVYPKSVAVTYGDATPTFEVVAITGKGTEVELTKTPAVKFKDEKYATAAPKNVGTYALTLAEAPTATGYTEKDFVILDGQYTISAKALTVTLGAQTLKGKDTEEDLDEELVEIGGVVEGDVLGWKLNFNIDETDGIPTAQVETAVEGKPRQIIESPKDASYAKGYMLVPVKSTEKNPNANANYTFTVQYGKLIVGEGTAEALQFKSVDADATTIANHAGETQNVTINFAPRNAQTINSSYGTWKAGYWNTMVLPFDISVEDISKALGYAIVNVIDATGVNYNSGAPIFKFRLTMKGGYGNDEVIPANHPFAVKIADDIIVKNPKDATKDYYYDFGKQTIVAPSDLSVDAGLGCKFIGTYTTTAVGKGATNAGQYRFLPGDYDKNWIVTSKSEWNIVPFAAYIDLTTLTPEEAAAAVFTFEEIDGTTTAIRSIDADNIKRNISAEGLYNLNGMKLNSVPTQKGVYIQNGKKVIIK